MVRRVLSALVVAAAVAAVGTAAPQNADAYLRGVIGLSAGDLKRVHAGEPVATSLHGHDGREVVTFGAIRISAAPEQVLSFLTTVEGMRHGPAVQQLGLLGTPPQPDDLAAFTMAPKSIESLRECRIGGCELQLPGWAISQFTTGAPRSTPDAHSAAQNTARTVATEILRAYQRGGHRALSPYEDRRPPTHPSAEYTRLLGAAEFLPAPLAALRNAVHNFPHQTPAGIRNQFYWTVMDYGMKPTFRINHLATATGPAIDDPSGSLTAAMLSLQVLSTHYYTSTVEWHFVSRAGGNTPSTHLYYLSRSFAPGLTGIRGRVSRFTIRGRAEDGIKAYLAFTKRRMEAGR